MDEGLAPDPAASPTSVVIIGTSNTAVRLCEELTRAGELVKVLAHGACDTWQLDEMRRHGADVMEAAIVREDDLRGAGVDAAKAVVILGQEDVLTVRLALAVEEVAPKTRLVLEMSHAEFGGHLSELLGTCRTLSSADLAAPSFVAACLSDGGAVQSFELAGRDLVAGPRSRVGGIIVPLGNSRRTDSDAAFHEDADIFLGTEVIGADRPTASRSGLMGVAAQLFSHRMRWVLLALLAWLVLSTLYFSQAVVLSCDSHPTEACRARHWWDAVFYALTGMPLAELRDSLRSEFWIRGPGVVLQLIGLILSALVTAVIVDAFVGARMDAIAGGVRGKPRNHVVVCGLGRVGKEVALRLARGKVPVVAIEKNESSAGVMAARRARIPVIIAEATDREALEQAGIANAACVLAITDNDAVNLETALMAHSANAQVRIITRLFDHDLADRVERRLKLGHTRSVSMLAAPAFAAAALGRRMETIVSVGRRVLIFTELTVQSGSESADGISTLAIAQRKGVLLLAWQKAGETRWSWDIDSVTLVADDRIAVAATRIGLAGVLRLIKRPASLEQEPVLAGEAAVPPEVRS